MGRVTSTVPGPTVTSPPFSHHTDSSATPLAEADRTAPRTVIVVPTGLNFFIRDPRIDRIVPSRPMYSRTVLSHAPSRKEVAAYISGAPVDLAYSELWWIELKSRQAPASITNR